MKIPWLRWLSYTSGRWFLYVFVSIFFWTVLRSLNKDNKVTSVVDFNNRAFPQLEYHVNDKLQYQNSALLKRIFIVTTEFDGLVKGGGISTAFTALALKMTQSGHSVSVLFVGKLKYGDESAWVAFYKEKGITLIFVPTTITTTNAPNYVGCSGPCIRSYLVYETLLQYENDVDVIHFQDHTAVGYFTIQSKHQGIHFISSTICLGTHGPFLWERTANQFYLDDSQHIELDFLERKSAECVDYIISPSHYMLNWMVSLNWKISSHSFVHQNLLPWTHSLQPSTEENANEKSGQYHKVVVNELVFFGRLEVRKGLFIFCDALKLIPHKDMPLVTFMGKDTILTGNTMASSFIQNVCTQLDITCQINTTLSHSQAIEYLTKPNKLVIIASTIDNSPNTVLECLTHQIPFLASDVGGISELIRIEDRPHMLFSLHPHDLAEKIVTCLKNRASIARLFQDEYTRHKVWSDFHAFLPPSKNPQLLSTSKNSRPEVSIVFCFPGSIEKLDVVLNSIQSQDHPSENIKIIVYLSEQQKSWQKLIEKSLERWKHAILTLRESNVGFIQMWNQMVSSLSGDKSLLQGEWIVLFDLMNTFYKPGSLSTIFRILSKTNADILTGHLYNEESQTFTLYPACSLGLGIIKNCFGSNLVVKKNLLHTLKTFDHDSDLWEFYIRCNVRNFSIEVSVDPLFSVFSVDSTPLSTFPNYTQGVKMAKQVHLPNTMETTLIVASHFSQTKDPLWKSIQTQQKSIYDLEKKIQTESNQLKMDTITCQNQKNTLLGINENEPKEVFKESKNMKLFLVRGYEESGLETCLQLLNQNHKIFVSNAHLNISELGQALQTFTSAKWVLGKSDPYQTVIQTGVIQYIQHVLFRMIGEPSKKPNIEWIGHISNSPMSPLLPNTPYILITRDGRQLLVDIFLKYVKFASYSHLCSSPLVSAELVNKYREDNEYFDKNPSKLLSSEECVRQVARKWAQHTKKDLEIETIIKNDLPPSRNNNVLRLDYNALFELNGWEKISFFLNLKTNTQAFVQANTQRPPLESDYMKYYNQQSKWWFQFETGNILKDLGYLSDINNDW